MTSAVAFTVILPRRRPGTPSSPGQTLERRAVGMIAESNCSFFMLHYYAKVVMNENTVLES